jgi:hypothetical protein
MNNNNLKDIIIENKDLTAEKLSGQGLQYVCNNCSILENTVPGTGTFRNNVSQFDIY